MDSFAWYNQIWNFYIFILIYGIENACNMQEYTIHV